MFLRPITPESIFEYSVVSDPEFSPDGSRIIFVREVIDAGSDDYLTSVWIINSAGNGKPFRVTSGSHDSCPHWSPDGKKIAFISARDGSPQIYVIPVDGGEAVRITNMVAGISDLRWSPDGKWIAFISEATGEERALEDRGLLYDPTIRKFSGEWSQKHRAGLKDPRIITKLPYRTGRAFFDSCYRHIYVIPSMGGAPKRLTNGDFHHSVPEWTPDSNYVITNSNRIQANGDENFEIWSSLFRYDIHTAEETLLVSEISEEGRDVLISPDGQWLLHPYVLKDIPQQETPSPYQEPYRMGVSPYKAKADPVCITGCDLTVEDFCWDKDSEHIFLRVFREGKVLLVRMTKSGQDEQVITDGNTFIEQYTVSPDGKSIAYTANSSTRPGDLYIVQTASGKTRRLTAFNSEFERTHYLSSPHEVWFKDPDGVDIQGWYYLPRNYDPSKKYPMAVIIHGGPQWMDHPRFNLDRQFINSSGFIYFHCNPRGSSGYGAEFQRSRGMGGEKDMADVMAGVDHILQTVPSADPERLVVTGASYGGFLTGWVATHTDRFKAAIAQSGVYDQLAMFGTGDIPESEEWYYGGVPSNETLMTYWKESPVAYAKFNTTPLLLVHHELDYRVPISLAESFFAHLRRNGNKTAEFLRFPNEDHGMVRNGDPIRRVHRDYLLLSWFYRFVEATDKDITRKELRSWLRMLPGWKADSKGLYKTFECGTTDIALRMLTHVTELTEISGKTADFHLIGTTLTIRLADPNTHTACMREVLLAKWLNVQGF